MSDIRRFEYAGETCAVDIAQDTCDVVDDVTDILLDLTYTHDDEDIYSTKGIEWIHERAERIAAELIA